MFGKSLFRAGLVTTILMMTSFWLPVPVVRADQFQVNSAADTSDANIGDRRCADLLDRCTLRAAIQELNSGSSRSTFNELTFDIPQPRRIELQSALPPINQGGGALTLSGAEGDDDDVPELESSTA